MVPGVIDLILTAGALVIAGRWGSLIIGTYEPRSVPNHPTELDPNSNFCINPKYFAFLPLVSRFFGFRSTFPTFRGEIDEELGDLRLSASARLGGPSRNSSFWACGNSYRIVICCRMTVVDAPPFSPRTIRIGTVVIGTVGKGPDFRICRRIICVVVIEIRMIGPFDRDTAFTLHGIPSTALESAPAAPSRANNRDCTCSLIQEPFVGLDIFRHRIEI